MGIWWNFFGKLKFINFYLHDNTTDVLVGGAWNKGLCNNYLEGGWETRGGGIGENHT